jgi:hypothetical protein
VEPHRTGEQTLRHDRLRTAAGGAVTAPHDPATAVVTDSVITCPHCGHAKREGMPVDSCLFFYECEQCKALLRPRLGDCCVFCSYGTVPCPPVQRQSQGDRCC